MRLHRAARYDEAARLCCSVLAHAPAHVGALVVLAEGHELQGRLGEALTLTDKALALSPDNPFAWNKRGSILGKANRLDEALAAFERAHALEPGNCDTLRNLVQTLFLLDRFEEALSACDTLLGMGDEQACTLRGRALRKLGRPVEALDSLIAGASVAPNNANLQAMIGGLQFELERFEDAEASYRKAIDLEPKRAVYLSNLGLTLSELGRYGEALGAFDAGLMRDPDNAIARWNRALVLLVTGKFAEGLAEYEARFAVDGPRFERVRSYAAPPLARGADICGQTILLYCGQGLGDAIQFFRFAPLLISRGARVVVEAQRSLCPLLSKSTPDVAVVAQGEPLPPFDRHAPMASLPFRLGLNLEAIGGCRPYLAAEPSKRVKWRARLDAAGRGRKVGVAWAGNPQHVRDKRRSLPLPALARVFERSDIIFVNLQKDARPGDGAILARHENVLDVSAELADFCDTAALVSELDLVITIDSAVAHLSGALGRPVWVLLPFAPDWRWLLSRSDSPWYPSARLFRQPKRGDWDSVVAQVTAALAQGDARPAAVAG